MLFKEVVERTLKGEFAYKHGQPQKLTISRIIATREGKEYVQPTVDILNKFFINTFVVSEDADTRALTKWRSSVMCPINKPNVVENELAIYIGNYYIYLEEGINVGYVFAAISYGNVPILPSFFREDFGECAVYYKAELAYPHYSFSVASLYSAIREAFKNERLYYSKLKCIIEKFK
ncbi:hypothetical protein [Sulfurisphaera ohwakuensis]|uniref:hypothetical protein n=1 Tax=Sulfurisphaera ohwakuensis TaxID=69656 RepID=UPI0036F3CE80